MNKKFNTKLIVLLVLVFGIILVACSNSAGTGSVEIPEMGLFLPTPFYESETSVEAALLARRSVRDYSGEPLTLAEISQILWAAQGITSDWGGRTAPSAGALYPLEVYLLAVDVNALPAGIYRYKPDDHALKLILEGDQCQALYEAALSQGAVKDAAAAIVLTAIYERTTVKYDQRGIQYAHIEIGSAAQNIYLQAVALDLGTVFIGAFEDDQVRALLQLSDGETPLGIMPIGRK